MPTNDELQIATISGVIYPNTVTRFQIVPPASKTRLGAITTGTNQLTVNSATGITANLYIFANGIPTGTQVQSILGNVLTLTKNATASFSRETIIFYTTSTDGLLPLKVGQTIKFLE